jgi:hypothetical protein
MTDIPIEQALYGGQGPGGYQFLARSPGFLDDWLPEAERLCTAFGDRPAGVSCPGCVFAQPLGKQHVAVVRAADQGSDDAGRPGALGFHVLVLPRQGYADLGGDPFLIADRYPPPWHGRGVLPSLTWEGGPPPRTLAQVQQLLQRPGGASLFPDAEVPRGGSQVLLGGCQALVDGAKLVFERPAPDTDLVRGLWTLLPTSTRTALWPASFAFGNALPFDAVVVPHFRPEDYPGYKTEPEAADYPEGRYELSLQTAAESGSQRDLDALFARRSQAETFRLLILLLVVLVALTAAIRFLPNFGGVAPAPTAPDSAGHGRAAPDLPPADRYPTLTADERDRLARALDGLARQLDVTPPDGASPDHLLEVIDRRLGTPDPRRDPGALSAQGPPQRQLRVLLWKHGVAEYRDPGLNPVELVERLQQKVAPPPAAQKETAR